MKYLLILLLFARCSKVLDPINEELSSTNKGLEELSTNVDNTEDILSGEKDEKTDSAIISQDTVEIETSDTVKITEIKVQKSYKNAIAYQINNEIYIFENNRSKLVYTGTDVDIRGPILWNWNKTAILHVTKGSSRGIKSYNLNEKYSKTIMFDLFLSEEFDKTEIWPQDFEYIDSLTLAILVGTSYSSAKVLIYDIENRETKEVISGFWKRSVSCYNGVIGMFRQSIDGDQEWGPNGTVGEIDILTGETRTIVRDIYIKEFKISKLGTLAYIREGIKTININTYIEYQVTDSKNDRGPRWAPDNESILFNRNDELMIVKSDGKDLKSLKIKGHRISYDW